MPVDPDITKDFQVGVVLGKGSYGTVYAAIHRRTGQPVAIKVMARERLGAKGESNVKNEITVMSLLDHPKILKMHKALYSRENISIVMDKVNGGELLKRLLKLRHYSERTAALIMRNLLQGIAYMHAEGVVHRDLKPDNMLLLEKPTVGGGELDEVCDIKIADFGFASKYRGEVLTQPCGTPYYIAPEILHVGVFKTRTSYGHHVDMWSAGVIAYILLSGRPPYDAKDKQRLFHAIARGGHDFTHSVWNGISVEGKDFIRKVLQTDPLKRLTAEDALKHDWLQALEPKDKGNKKSSLPDVHLSESLTHMEEFDAREKIKGAVFGIEAAFRMLYLGNCKKNNIHPNTALLEKLTSTTNPIYDVDLSNNYVGAKGVEQLIKIISQHTEVHRISLANSLIDDALLEKLCFSLAAPTSKVHTIVLDDNPITHAGGRQILALLYRNERIRKVSLARTHISDSIKKKIEKLLERLPTLPTQHHRPKPAATKRGAHQSQALTTTTSHVPKLPSIHPASAPTGDQGSTGKRTGSGRPRQAPSHVPSPTRREQAMDIQNRRAVNVAGNSRLPPAAAVFFGKQKPSAGRQY